MAEILIWMGFDILCFRNTAMRLKRLGIDYKLFKHQPTDIGELTTMIAEHTVHLVIHIHEHSLLPHDSKKLLASALHFGVSYVTTLPGVRMFIAAVEHNRQPQVRHLREWYQYLR